MKVGRVIGRVVLSERIPELPIGRWLLVSPMGRKELQSDNRDEISAESSPVVFDDLGAGLGDLVGYTEGGEAIKPFDHPVPIDAYNSCILDSVEILEEKVSV